MWWWVRGGTLDPVAIFGAVVIIASLVISGLVLLKRGGDE